MATEKHAEPEVERVSSELQSHATSMGGDAIDTPSGCADRRTASTVRESGENLYPLPELVVALDGSGDFRQIEQALDAATAGTLIRIRAGLHSVSRPLVVRRSVSLLGEGKDDTTITGIGGPQVIRIVSNVRFEARDLTLECAVGGAGDVFQASTGDIAIHSCRFYRGAKHEGERGGGCGARLQGDVRGAISLCQFEGNELHGLYVDSTGELILDGNTCEGNGHGIYIWGGAHAMAIKNGCSGNHKHGIRIGHTSTPVLEANECTSNGRHGIYVGEKSRPKLIRNTCSYNRRIGIQVSDESTAYLLGNVCSDNHRLGICVDATAHPVLLDNKCSTNRAGNIRDERQPPDGTAPDGNSCKDLNSVTSLGVQDRTNRGLLELDHDRSIVGKAARPGNRLERGRDQAVAAASVYPSRDSRGGASNSAHALPSELRLSVRTERALQRAGVGTMVQLIGLTEEELLSIRNIGAGAVDEIQAQLYRFLTRPLPASLSDENACSSYPSQ